MRHLKSLLSTVVAIILVLAAIPIATPASDGLRETTIEGIYGKITSNYSYNCEQSVTIKPATGGRKVKLQIYLKSKNAYHTVKTYNTKSASQAKINLVFPKKWRRRRTGNWRLVVQKSDTARGAVKKIKLNSINIYKKKPIKLKSKSVCIYCIEDDVIVYGKRVHERRKNASTTKVMTSIVLLESDDLYENTRISRKAANTSYGNIYMKAGDVYRNIDLLYALMLKSSNDSATAIAEGVSGSVENFAKAMNTKARELGLEDSHFVTPHGLDAKHHYSSAYDLCKMMAYIYPNNATFRRVIARKKYAFSSKRYNEKRIVSTTDALKSKYKYHKGGKTGFTSGAGYCFTSVYVKRGKTYTVAILGAKKMSGRWSDMKKLYHYINSYANTSY
ncbi:MAG: D-alanyl-D-alanine carboxypeptidase [Eubacterium sp.]|nr:D-alanyl-D-alanine carboxypeptidase [Eubacterium sp.]